MKYQFIMQKRAFTLALVAGAGLIHACSDSKSSKGIPRLVTELSTDDIPPELLRKMGLWDKFADAIGIGKNSASSQTALETQLGTPSSYLAGDKESEYEGLLTSISEDYLKTANNTKCAAVESVTELSTTKLVSASGEMTDLAGATAHIMKYKLQADAKGTSEEAARTALLIIPTYTGTNGDSSPIVAYGHGGSAGLGYGEISSVFSKLQTSHIIVAPTYPGEPLCKVAGDAATGTCDSSGELAAATGTRSVWSGDADELLGAHDCVLKALANTYPSVKVKTSADVDTGLTISQKIGAVVMMHDGFNPPIPKAPSSIVVGASRGGLVALLAVARSAAAGNYIAAMMKAKGDAYTAADGLGTAYGSGPSIFNCAATLSAPVTFTAGRNRLALETMVRGEAKGSPFYKLPGVADLAPIFDAYAASGSDVDLEALKVEVLKRDATIVGPLILGALQDWTQGRGVGKGSLLMLHGTMDKIVGFENMQLGQNIFLGQSQALATLKKAPGVNLYARAFSPTSEYLDASGKLKEGSYQHGDPALLTSTATLPGTLIAASVTSAALANAQAEGAAGQMAKTLFNTETPTDAQLAVARNYVLSGMMPKLTATIASDNMSILEKTAEKADVTPLAAFAVWRENYCTVQDLP